MLPIVRLKRRKKPHLALTATTRNRRQHKEHQSRINKTHIPFPTIARSSTTLATVAITTSIVQQIKTKTKKTQTTITLKRTTNKVNTRNS